MFEHVVLLSFKGLMITWYEPTTRASSVISMIMNMH